MIVDYTDPMYYVYGYVDGLIDLPKDFQQGWNGTFDLDLSIKGFGGLAIPVAEGSGGIFADARDSNAFRVRSRSRGAS